MKYIIDEENYAKVSVFHARLNEMTFHLVYL